MAKVPDGYVEGVMKRNEEFLQLLDGEDDLGMVIRAHIHIEHELREFIVAAAPQPAELKLSDYDYASTLKLAILTPDQVGLLLQAAREDREKGIYVAFPPTSAR